MAAWRHHRGTHAAVAYGSVERLLADTKKSGRLARADEFAESRMAFQSVDVVRQEAAMAARRHQRRLEQSARDRAENCRSADTKALC